MDVSYQLSLPLAPGTGNATETALPIDQQFDVDLANGLAQLESYNKHLYRPNTYLHKWWARRCGSTFRLILKHLVDPARAAQRDYYAPGGLEGKVVLDPMMGGGTTLHEAIRMGANVIGADIDPIPVLQARASLSSVPLQQLETAFEGFFGDLSARLRPFFLTECPQCRKPTPLQFTLYGQKRSCGCGPALFMDSLVLRYEPDGSKITICPECHTISQHATQSKCPCGHNNERQALPPIREKGTKFCPDCGTPYEEDLAIPFHFRYEPTVVVAQCSDHGLFFKSPSQADREAARRADAARVSPAFKPLQDFDIEAGPKSADLVRRGITNYLDLFSSRQLLFLKEAIALLDTFDSLTRLNLALLVSTSLEFNSMLCGYKGGHKRRPGAIRHTFSHHAYAFPYTALENNPIFPQKTSGTLQKLFHDRIRRGRKWAMLPKERLIRREGSQLVTLRGELDMGTEVSTATALQSGIRRFLLIQGSSAALDLADESVDFVVTDPPYFDSVQYSDLAGFFRVWLRHLVPAAARWDYDMLQSAVDPHADGNGQYTRVLSDIFEECHRVLKGEQGRLVFTYHHWNPKAWAALTIALKRAKFRLVNRYVVHSENPVSVHISNLRALVHDAVLVLAPTVNQDVRQWQLVSEVNADDSFHFNKDCATILGWMLAGDLNEDEIQAVWIGLLS